MGVRRERVREKGSEGYEGRERQRRNDSRQNMESETKGEGEGRERQYEISRPTRSRLF